MRRGTSASAWASSRIEMSRWRRPVDTGAGACYDAAAGARGAGQPRAVTIQARAEDRGSQPTRNLAAGEEGFHGTNRDVPVPLAPSRGRHYVDRAPLLLQLREHAVSASPR